ncbi:MAG: Flp pilus assembly complex ATPase component TadA [Gammaproteobacteria bacterium]|nr:Flp pilus assembly complex ATPase component TadA [Gammaproteobacteria bacterium]
MFDVVVKDEKGRKVHGVRCPINECGIGKARDNLIQLRGWRIAPHHAELSRNAQGIFIEDKSKSPGTYVNDQKVERHGPLRASDVVRIGSYFISVGIDETADADDDYSEDIEDVKTMIGVSRHVEIKEDSTVFKEERYKWRNRVHSELLEAMDLRRTDIGAMSEDRLRKHVQNMIHEIVEAMSGKLPANIDKQQLEVDVLNEAVGLGPLEELLAQDDITEVMVNKFDEIFIEKAGRLQKSTVTFSSNDAVMSAIERIVSPLGRRIDESSPMVDARLKDGSRVNAIIPPLALRGPCITIRKFSKQKLADTDLVKFGAADANMFKFLKVAVEMRKNIVISGGTGSGKTTLLNVLSNYIPSAERIVTVEDAAELKLGQPHIVSLEARPPNLEGKGAIHIRDLVKNCLRMRPDRIVVGECRGGEALDMLQAMNTGHDGSLTTAHANSPRDLISRLEVMVMMSGMDLPALAIREMVASAVDIIVQISRFADGSRKVVNISEITGVESGVVQMQDIFRFQQQGFDENGKVRGHYHATGRIPEFYEELRERGIGVDMSIFQ